MTENLLEIRDLHVSVEDTKILNGVDLTVPRGEVHAFMGPNGSGKSTLAQVLMGHPGFEVSSGEILFEGEDVSELDPEDRAQRGMFLAFQYPVEVPGVSVSAFLRTAMGAVRGEEVPVREFMTQLRESLKLLDMDEALARRGINEGFSGGEKKRNEILQLALLAPKLSILDETDSGLDIDALKIVAEAVNNLRSDEGSFLVITHYARILEHLKPDVVHILLGGRVVKSGSHELAQELESEGYEGIRKEYGIDTDEAQEETATT